MDGTGQTDPVQLLLLSMGPSLSLSLSLSLFYYLSPSLHSPAIVFSLTMLSARGTCFPTGLEPSHDHVDLTDVYPID